MFNAVNAGLNFTVVGSMAGEPSGQAADGLVVGSALRGQLNDPGDLKGMKVAVNGGPGAAGGYLLAQALAPYHLTLADVTPVNLALPEQADALRSGAVAAALMSSPFLADAVNSGVGTLIAPAAPGTSVTGVIYSKDFAAKPAAQEFFDSLAEGAQDLQGDGASAPHNLQIEADATHESLDVLEREPANVFDPRLAPQTETLDAMQEVYLQSGLLGYQTPIPSSRYVDGEFSARVPTG
jgi:NitT/TauT family transport system substrate-binding protein